MATARIETSAEGQILHLPPDIHVDATEVEVFRQGEDIVLRRASRGKGLEALFHALASLPEGVLDHRDDPPPEEREGL